MYLCICVYEGICASVYGCIKAFVEVYMCLCKGVCVSVLVCTMSYMCI